MATRNKKGREEKVRDMALSQRMDIRQVLAAAVFAATTSIASPLYLAVFSEQTASDAAWLAVAETLAERHGGEIITYAASAFPEALRLGLAACRSHFYPIARPAEVARTDEKMACLLSLRLTLRKPSGDGKVKGMSRMGREGAISIKKLGLVLSFVLALGGVRASFLERSSK